MQELVKFLVSQLVENKDDVLIQTNEEEKATIITALVNNADLGKVIGHNGKVANSIRTIVKSANIKTDKKIIVKFAAREQ